MFVFDEKVNHVKPNTNMFVDRSIEPHTGWAILSDTTLHFCL